MLAGKATEELLRTKMDQCVSQKGFSKGENVPIFVAVSKVAPKNSEARIAAQIDSHTCDLVGRIEESGRLASTTWEAVDATKTALSMSVMASQELSDKELGDDMSKVEEGGKTALNTTEEGGGNDEDVPAMDES